MAHGKVQLARKWRTRSGRGAAVVVKQATGATLTRSAAQQQALGLAAQQRHALTACNATAAALLRAHMAANVAANLHAASVPQRAQRGNAFTAQQRSVRACVAARAHAQHLAAQAQLGRAQRAHTHALRAAAAVGVKRAQVGPLYRAQAARHAA
jgi:hypothetical protein